MTRALALWLLLAGCRANAESLPVEPPPPAPPRAVAASAKLVRVVDGLRQPVALTYAPGDGERRLFIVEKPGAVRVLRGDKLDALPFLDVHDRVSNATEQGLLGLAFHPKFAENGRFYVNYTGRKGDTRVIEFDRAYHERERLFVKQPFDNHNGGDLVFGPDGKLYVGLGDGGWANDPFGHGQGMKTLLAKMVRLDVDARWEEIDVVSAGMLDGRNFGWKIMEGLHCRSGRACDRRGLTLPVVENNHQAGCSVTGGFVYRGRALPLLDGAYCRATARQHLELRRGRRRRAVHPVARRRRVGATPDARAASALARRRR